MRAPAASAAGRAAGAAAAGTRVGWTTSTGPMLMVGLRPMISLPGPGGVVVVTAVFGVVAGRALDGCGAGSAGVRAAACARRRSSSSVTNPPSAKAGWPARVGGAPLGRWVAAIIACTLRAPSACTVSAGSTASPFDSIAGTESLVPVPGPCTRPPCANPTGPAAKNCCCGAPANGGGADAAARACPATGAGSTGFGKMGVIAAGAPSGGCDGTGGGGL